MHASTWRVGNDDIGATMFGYKITVEDVLHISCIKQGIVYAVDTRVLTRILNGFGNIFYTDDLSGLMCHKIGYGASTRV